MLQVIDQTVANTVHEWLHHAAKVTKNYAKRKVQLDDQYLDSDSSKFLPASANSEEDNGGDKKKAKSKALPRKENWQPIAVLDTAGGGDEESEEDVNIVCYVIYYVFGFVTWFWLQIAFCNMLWNVLVLYTKLPVACTTNAVLVHT